MTEWQAGVSIASAPLTLGHDLVCATRTCQPLTHAQGRRNRQSWQPLLPGTLIGRRSWPRRASRWTPAVTTCPIRPRQRRRCGDAGRRALTRSQVNPPGQPGRVFLAATARCLHFCCWACCSMAKMPYSGKCEDPTNRTGPPPAGCDQTGVCPGPSSGPVAAKATFRCCLVR